MGEEGVKKGISGGGRVVSEDKMEVYERGIRKKEKKNPEMNTSLLFHLWL